MCRGSCLSPMSRRQRNGWASLLLGALLPTVLLLFFLTSDRVGIWSFGDSHANLKEEEKFPGLAELLPKVATAEGTVIITSVNEAFARSGSLLGFFLDSFRAGEGIERLLDHLLVVTVDAGAFAHCRALHRFCYLHELNSGGGVNISSANRFKSQGYLDLVWARLPIQQHILHLRYNYLFTDVDIMWLRDPFRHISILDADMAVSTDRFNGGPGGDALPKPNMGFYYVRSSNRTLEMLRRWRAARSHGLLLGQAFNEIKAELAASDLHLKLVFLDTAIFGGFCQFHGEMDRVCTMHANCCIGLHNKLHDLRNMATDWSKYIESIVGNDDLRWTFPAWCKASIIGATRRSTRLRRANRWFCRHLRMCC